MRSRVPFLALALVLAGPASPHRLGAATDPVPTPCVNGRAGEFPCSNTTLLSRVNLSESGIRARGMSDVWGWTDPVTKREYALVGMTSKTSIVDITDPLRPAHVADLPAHGTGSIWRDIEVYADHAFIVSEAMGHGMQVLDLTLLRKLVGRKSPVVLAETAHYPLFSNCHTVAISTETGFAYAAGTNTCDGGLHVVDIRDPKKPKFATCVDRGIFEPDSFGPARRSLSAGRAADGDGDEAYTHDAQCTVYRGPDRRYHGREICLASNDDTLNIVDVTDKNAPRQISVVRYANHGFVHQGWLTEDHRHFLLNDEGDEATFGVNTTTFVFDVQDLEAPRLLARHAHETRAIDHNLYIKGNYAYEANYSAGLRVMDLTEVASGKLKEAAFFDVYPKDDLPAFVGSWAVFPYFASGVVAVGSMEGTLYVVKPALK